MTSLYGGHGYVEFNDITAGTPTGYSDPERAEYNPTKVNHGYQPPVPGQYPSPLPLPPGNSTISDNGGANVSNMSHDQTTNQQQQQIVIIQAPKLQRSFEHYSSKSASALGTIQVSLGCASFIIGIANALSCASYGVLGFGLWCGVLFIISGSFGVVSSYRKTSCMIITHMVMSVISAVSASVQFALAAAAAAYDVTDLNYWGCYYNVGKYHPGDRVNPSGAVATSALLAICAIIEAVTAILGSAISCKVICCSSRFTASPTSNGTAGAGVVPGHVVYFVNQPTTAANNATMYNPNQLSALTAPQHNGIYPNITQQYPPGHSDFSTY